MAKQIGDNEEENDCPEPSESCSTVEVSEEASEDTNMVSFSVGDSFKTFDELEKKIMEYEKVKSVQLWKRDSRTVKQKRVNRPLNPRIKYYELTYTCIHGGKRFKSYGGGKRASSTFRKGCPASISFRASEDGQYLVVKRVNDEHNHAVNRQLFKHLPRQRKLSNSEKEEVGKLLTLKANKKITPKARHWFCRNCHK